VFLWVIVSFISGKDRMKWWQHRLAEISDYLKGQNVFRDMRMKRVKKRFTVCQNVSRKGHWLWVGTMEMCKF
jgi:hypothetical protein